MKRLLTIFLFIVLATGLRAQSNIRIDIQPQTAYTAEPGQYKFERPRATVYDGEENVSDAFFLTYYIKGKDKTTDRFTYDNKIVTENTATGTRVSYSYGIIFVGDKAGVDTIEIKASPRDSTSAYPTVTSHYTITINSFAPKAYLSQQAFNLHPRQLVMFPTARLYRLTSEGDSTDITSYYDVSYSFSDGIDSLRRYYDYTLQMLLAPAEVNQDLWLTMTYTPKSKYAGAYQPFTKTFRGSTFKMHEANPYEIIPTDTLVWPDGKYIQGINSTEMKMLQPKVYDNYGNDISGLFIYDWYPKVEWPIINALWSSHNGDYNTWTIQFGFHVEESTNLYLDIHQRPDLIFIDPYIYQTNGLVRDGIDQVTVQGFKKDWSFNVVPSSYNVYAESGQLPVLTRHNWKMPVFVIYNPDGYLVLQGGVERNIGLPIGTLSGNYNGQAKGDTIEYHGVKYAFYPAEDYTFQDADWGTPWQINYNNCSDSDKVKIQSGQAPYMLFNIKPYNFHQEDQRHDYYNYQLIVISKLHTHIGLSQQKLAANIVGNELKGFSEPEATVRDENGFNVSNDFTLHYEIVSDSSVFKSFSIDPNTGKISYQSRSDDPNNGPVVVKVSAKTTNTDKYYADTEPSPVYYTICVTKSNFNYEVITDAMAEEHDYNKAHHGKLHFTGAGIMAAGTVINDMAGLSVQFGSVDDIAWTLQETSSSEFPDPEGSTYGKAIIITAGAPVDLDDNEIPRSGTFAILKPSVNGFLTIDGRWYKDNHYRLIRVEGDSIAGMVDFVRHDKDHFGDQWMRQPLMAGQTYYIYNYGADDGTNEPTRLHGFNFEPAFLNSSMDHEPNDRAVTFVNGYTGGVASMLTEPSEGVSFEVKAVTEKDAKGNTVRPTDYLTVNSSVGSITPKKRTAGITDNTITDFRKNRVLVKATVLNNMPDILVTKNESLYVFVTDIPSYIIRNGEIPSVGQKVTTTNIPTKITMTFGGWENGIGPNIDKKGRDNFDSWDPAKTDTVGQNGRIIDGFRYASQGANNPLDEEFNSFNGAKKDHLPWEAPCRGTYLQFNPEENGTLIVYILQNGILDYTGTEQWQDLRGKASGSSHNYQLKYRPLFIIDEAADSVTLDNSWVMDASLLPTNSNQATQAGSYTEGHYRSVWNDEWAKDELTKHGFDFSAKNAKLMTFDGSAQYHNLPDYNQCPYDLTKNYNGHKEELAKVMLQWSKYASYDDTEHARQEIVHLGNGGYMLLSKAFVRYTFQAKAGKTYYIFVRGSKLAPCGFSFVPSGFPDYDSQSSAKPEDMEMEVNETMNVAFNRVVEKVNNLYDMNTTLTDTGDGGKNTTLTGTDGTAPNPDLRNINFTLPRHFGNNKWTGICLPFSVSEQKFKDIFGEDASIITYDSLSNDTTGYFSQHVVHSIVANVPYFINPSKDVDLNTVIPNITIEYGFTPVSYTYVSLDSRANNPAANSYTVTGSFDATTIPAKSYVFAGSSIYELANDQSVGMFRAWLQPNTSTGSSSGSSSTSGTSSSKSSFGFHRLGFTNKATGKTEFDDGSGTTGINVVSFDDVNNPYGSSSGKTSATSRLSRHLRGVYNLKGQKVADTFSPTLPPGVYIVNGTKQVW